MKSTYLFVAITRRGLSDGEYKNEAQEEDERKGLSYEFDERDLQEFLDLCKTKKGTLLTVKYKTPVSCMVWFGMESAAIIMQKVIGNFIRQGHEWSDLILAYESSDSRLQVERTVY